MLLEPAAQDILSQDAPPTPGTTMDGAAVYGRFPVMRWFHEGDRRGPTGIIVIVVIRPESARPALGRGCTAVR
jgi:hypothetical protein